MTDRTYKLPNWWVIAATLTLLAMLVSLVLGAGPNGTPAKAQAVGTHGIGFAKGCDSPVNVGDPYNCGFLVANTNLLDTHGDTLTIDSLTDVVHAAPDATHPTGDFPSGEILNTRIIAGYSGGATCVDAANVLVPVGGTGAVLCTLPTGSAIAFARAPLYTVTAADVALSPIDDDATLQFEDLCTSGADDCPIGPNTTQAGASAPVNTPTPTPTPTNTPTNTPPHNAIN
jgi:hypothetical protein